MEEQCECKGCGGKVFLGIVVTAVIMALGVGGYMMWWANNNDNGTSTTASTATKDEAVKLDASKGAWTDTGTNKDMRTYTNTSLDGYKIEMNLDTTPTTDVDKTKWAEFAKSLKVIQGQDVNTLLLVTSDYQVPDKGMILLGIDANTISQWRNLREGGTVGNIIGVTKDNIALAILPPISLQSGEVATEFTGLKDEIVKVFGGNNVDISLVALK